MGDYVLKMCQFYPFVLQNVHLPRPWQGPSSSAVLCVAALPCSELTPAGTRLNRQEKKLWPSRELQTLKPKDSTLSKTMILYIKHLDKT